MMRSRSNKIAIKNKVYKVGMKTMHRKNICMLIIIISEIFHTVQAINPRTRQIVLPGARATRGMIDTFNSPDSHSSPAATPTQKFQTHYQGPTQQSSLPHKVYTPSTITFNVNLTPAKPPATSTLNFRSPQSQSLFPGSKNLMVQKNSLPSLTAFFNNQESLKTPGTALPVLEKKQTTSTPAVQSRPTIHPKNSPTAIEKRELRAEKKNAYSSLDISNNLEQINSPQAVQKRQQRADSKNSAPEINLSNNLEYSNSPTAVAQRNKRSEKKAEIDYTNNSENLYHRKAAQEKINIQEASIRGTVNKVSQEIDTWVQDYADPTSEFYNDLTSNNATQEILKDKILHLVRTKDSSNNYSTPDPAIIKRLQEKYSKNVNNQYSKDANVLDVLTNVSESVHKDTNSQEPIARQANNVVSQYTTNPQAQNTLFSFMQIQPQFDKFGKPTNVPSVEKIIQKSRDKKANQESYDTLKSTLQSVEVGLATAQGDPELTQQLQKFQKDITKELSNQKFKKFKPISEQMASNLPSKRELLDMTGVGTMTVTQAVDALSKNLKENPMIQATTSVASAIGLTPEAFFKKTGLQDMTILEFAEKTNIIKKDPQARPLQNTDQLLSKFEIYQKREAMKPILQANELVGRYYNGDEILALTNNSPMIDTSTRAVTNLPSVENLINNAINNPTAKNYQSLESAAKAIKTAQIASKNDPAMKQQLQLLDQQITTAMSNQALTPHQSWSTYLSSFAPSTKTVLTKTGIGNMKLSQVADIGKATTQKAYSLYETGVKWGIIPEKPIQDYIGQE